MTTDTSSQLRLGRIAATLGVSDIERSRTLYREIFGLEKVFENGSPVGFMILKKDEAELHLTLQKGYQAPPFNQAHIMVSDADAACRACEHHGLRIVKRLRNKDYGLRAFVFADPDGNRIDVAEEI
ncbi:VOC family protein [Roseibium aggregatum]|uniref:VOC family protein n=1 Tax=Roseibium aggregatum TaxID=187304 RepID=UPI001E30C98C|nr:VOC family protein [Roseibium aggregatum]UES39840.1 VOC family protein [Roseibium aggregatum]